MTFGDDTNTMIVFTKRGQELKINMKTKKVEEYF